MTDWHKVFALQRALNGWVSQEKWRRAYILADELDTLLGMPPRARVVPFRRP